MDKIGIIKAFEKKQVLLIGDTILDIYSYGREVCKSSDSDAPTVEEDKIDISFGGASLVARNILELGGQAIFFSVIGSDSAAKYYTSFSHPKLDKHFLIDKNRPTTVKKMFWANGQKLFQANQVDNRYIDADLEKKLIAEMEPFFSLVDVIVVLDAQHGLLSQGLISQLIELSQKYQKPLYADSQCYHRSSNHHLYRGADCLFFNQTEAKAANPLSLGIANFVIKLGREGSEAWFNNQHIKSPAYPVEVVDPCGAGDAFLAAFSLGSREALEGTLAIANIWGALAATIQGTRPPSKKELIKICQS